MPLALPAICVITRARGTSGSAERLRLLERLSAAAEAGATMIQIRERQLDDRRLLEFIADVLGGVASHGCLVLVNERTDVALAARAHGVHLKSDAPSGTDVRGIVPGGFVIGRSVHSLGEAQNGIDTGGCDYLLFGTVFPSRSKPEGHPVAGIEALHRVCKNVQLPVLAIGGLNESRAAQVAAAGASGIAAISLFAEAGDIRATVSRLRDALTRSDGSV
jgi:thiamine-phosphate diphosphorylase